MVMEGIVVMKYSKDLGATWSTATNINMKNLQVYVRFEPDDDASSENTSNTVCIRGKARVMVLCELDVQQFNPAESATADALFVFVNDLRCASIIHLYIASPAAVNGYTYWANANNTNYLAQEDIPDPTFEASNPGRIRSINFTLKLREERAIA
jgi:hypothetical protein